MRLEPLTADEADRLISDDVSGDLRERIARAAGGNPLFISEMLAMARERADVEVPPTLKALLAARLDQLDEPERRVLERGSVEGELFHRGAVQALAPEEPQVTARLTGLVRRELVRPDRPQLAGEDAFRFRHLLIRDAAYDALPKSVRAELHERFADWLDGHGELVELDEIVGYHLEQAAAYRRELGRPADDVAARAGDRLAAAGRRALWREDRRAARALLERALSLTRPLRLDVLLEVDLAATLFIEDSRRAAAIVEAAAERAAVEGDATGEAFGRAMAGYHRFNLNECSDDDLEALLLTALPLLEQEGNHAALVYVWEVLADLRGELARPLGRRGPSERAGAGARKAGRPATDRALLDRARARARADSGGRGARAARPAAARETRPVLAVHPGLAPGDARPLRRGRPARPGVERAAARAGRPPDRREPSGRDREDGGRPRDGSASPPDALRLARGARTARAPGHVRLPCSVASSAPSAASRKPRRSPGAGASSPATTRRAGHCWRQVQALVLAHRGEHAEAERLAREAVAGIEQTDSLTFQGDAWYDLAEVLAAAGRDEEAAAALAEALDRYERKQNIPLARQVRERLVRPSGRHRTSLNSASAPSAAHASSPGADRRPTARPRSSPAHATRDTTATAQDDTTDTWASPDRCLTRLPLGASHSGSDGLLSAWRDSCYQTCYRTERTQQN